MPPPTGDLVALAGEEVEADAKKGAPKLLAKLSDQKLALVIGVGLFVAVAWPLLFLRIPPYQDLPGHLAAVTILANPDRYPELAATGFFKPNSFFFLWTLTVGRSIGFVTAAKILVLGILLANALVLPRFVLHFGGAVEGRRRMLLATPFLVPIVHNWFVSMGMLNFAASIPPTLLLIMELDRLDPSSSGAATTAAPTATTRGRGGAIKATALALLSWYLHPFPVLVVGLLVAASAASELFFEKRSLARPLRDRFTRARAMIPPLVPAALLAAFIFTRHVAVTGPKMDKPEYSTPGWALYNIWGHFTYGFTELTAASIVAAIVLAVIAAMRWRGEEEEGCASILGPAAFVVLALAYLLGPYVAFDANYITPRLVPFLWAAALIRIPSRLPRIVNIVVGATAAIYIVGMPIDLFRLSRELDDFAAGTPAVPDGARLLQLNFNARPTSKNTFSLGTAWGLYVLERHTSAIDAWANVPSMPIVYRTPLPTHLEPMMRLRFIKNAATKDGFCEARRWNGFYSGDCDAMWRAEWDGFWRDALPRFDYILLWDPPVDVIPTLPSDFHESFVRGRLHIFARSSLPR